MVITRTVGPEGGGQNAGAGYVDNVRAVIRQGPLKARQDFVKESVHA